jgi:CheY-like chemotaxis protein/transcriptional regulator with XRE-family HTH domain
MGALNPTIVISRGRNGQNEAMKRTPVGQSPGADETLVAWVRHALRHLYEPSVLLTNPLLGLVGLPSSFEGAAELRRRLIAIIRALKPEDHVPSHALPWRVYEVLLYRYVQQFSQLEVADQLGMSIRHLRRAEHEAMGILAAVLQREYGISRPVGPAAGVRSEETGTDRLVADELAWLETTSLGQAADLAVLLPNALNLAGPLIHSRGIVLEGPSVLAGTLASLHPVLLRQLTLGVLTLITRIVGIKRVAIDVHPLSSWVEISFTAEPLIEPGADAAIRTDLEVLRELAAAGRARLDIRSNEGQLVVAVNLPRVEPRVILVIDDNRATWNLIERLLSGLPYEVCGAADLGEALRAAGRVRPSVIILDVMMPELDGWEILQRLREDSRTSGVPVLVCTILPEEELAYSLGASAFLRKPIRRLQLVSVLDQLTGQAVPGSRPGPGCNPESPGP